MELSPERMIEYLRDQSMSMKGVLETKSHQPIHMLESNTDGYFTLDQKWQLTYFNKAAEELFFNNHKNLLGKVIWGEISDNLNPLSFQKIFLQTVREQKPVYFEVSTYPEGNWMEVHAYPTNTGLSVFFRDITQRKQIEDQLRLSEERFTGLFNEIGRLDRLELIAKMAGSISHEIRNPLTTVRGFLQLLSKKPDTFRYHEYFSLMIEELDRANAIISEYLSLANNTPIEIKPLNINQIIEKLLPLIQADALMTDNYIQIELQKVPDLLLNKREIRQLLLNLVRNGLEAMSPGGCLSINTFSEGEEVILTVQDQGHGIPADILDKVGTLFFSTKDYGTGLGLSICYSIAQRHNASIKINTGNTGTTFLVRFKKQAH